MEQLFEFARHCIICGLRPRGRLGRRFLELSCEKSKQDDRNRVSNGLEDALNTKLQRAELLWHIVNHLRLHRLAAGGVLLHADVILLRGGEHEIGWLDSVEMQIDRGLDRSY